MCPVELLDFFCVCVPSYKKSADNIFFQRVARYNVTVTTLDHRPSDYSGFLESHIVPSTKNQTR